MSKENKELPLEGKNITVGICAVGDVEKIFKILKSLKKEGANVEIILTPNAAELMPLVLLQRETNKPILIDQMALPKVFDADHKKDKPDLILVAPATANTVNKLASGIADNLLTTRVLSAKCPVAVSINCNPHMYEKPATQRSLNQLREDGFYLIENPEKPNKTPSSSLVIEMVKSILDI